MNDTQTPPRTAYTAQEVAASLNLPIKQVYQLCKDGRIRNFRAGKHYRIPVDALPEFLARVMAGESA